MIILNIIMMSVLAPNREILPVYSLIFTINMWPNVFSNIWLFLNLVKLGIKNFQKFKWFQNCAYFSFQLQWLLSYWHFYDSSLHKSTKTYPRSMLLWGEGGRNWQKSYPNKSDLFSVQIWIFVYFSYNWVFLLSE